MNNLFSPFEESNYETWCNQLTKDLKGITVDELKKINKDSERFKFYKIVN